MISFMRRFTFIGLILIILAIPVSCGQHSKKNEMKSLAEIEAETEAQAVEEARQASETRKRLLAERDEKLKEELGADEIIGFWSFRQASLSGTITIYSMNGSYKGRIVFSDKSIHNENLAKEGDGLFYVIENGHHNRSGEYYRIVGSNLSVCDKDGNVGWTTQVELHANAN
jgi:hypothetical protein